MASEGGPPVLGSIRAASWRRLRRPAYCRRHWAT